jgi:hypothetical protein
VGHFSESTCWPGVYLEMRGEICGRRKFFCSVSTFSIILSGDKADKLPVELTVSVKELQVEGRRCLPVNFT